MKSFRLYFSVFLVFLAIAVLGYSEEPAEEIVDTTHSDQPDYPSQVYIVDIDGAIGTVSADRIIEAVDICESEMADLLVIRMDTPGGFNDALWPITRTIMNSRVPVVVYVSPAGARAASAGVYIVPSSVTCEIEMTFGCAWCWNPKLIIKGSTCSGLILPSSVSTFRILDPMNFSGAAHSSSFR